MLTHQIAIACLLSFTLQAANQPFSVSQVKWSRSVQKKGKEFPIEQIPAEVNRDDLIELHLRFIIVGNEETLSYLEKNNTLQVFVEWHLDGNVVNEPTPELGISNEDWEKGEDEWRQEVAERGSFVFHTHAKRTTIRAGRYSAIIRDSNHKPIGPVGAPIPFESTITITPPKPPTTK